MKTAKELKNALDELLEIAGNLAAAICDLSYEGVQFESRVDRLQLKLKTKRVEFLKNIKELTK